MLKQLKILIQQLSKRKEFTENQKEEQNSFKLIATAFEKIKDSHFEQEAEVFTWFYNYLCSCLIVPEKERFKAKMRKQKDAVKEGQKLFKLLNYTYRVLALSKVEEPYLKEDSDTIFKVKVAAKKKFKEEKQIDIFEDLIEKEKKKDYGINKYKK